MANGSLLSLFGRRSRTFRSMILNSANRLSISTYTCSNWQSKVRFKCLFTHNILAIFLTPDCPFSYTQSVLDSVRPPKLKERASLQHETKVLLYVPAYNICQNAKKEIRGNGKMESSKRHHFGILHQREQALGRCHSNHGKSRIQEDVRDELFCFSTPGQHLTENSKPQYERTFREWGITKNVKEEEWKFIIDRLDERDLRGEASMVKVRGIAIPEKKLQRQRKKQRISVFDCIRARKLTGLMIFDN